MTKWQKVKLGDVCEVARGGSPRPIDNYITNDADGVNWIKIGDASENSKYIEKTKQKIKKEGVIKSRYVKIGDFLLSNSMSFGRPYILKIDGCIHDGWLVLRDKKSVYCKEFLYYALSSPTIYRKFKQQAVGGVVNNLNSDIVKNTVVPLPPREEQERIAKELDAVSDLLAKQKQLLTEQDTLIKSVFYDMFGDPVTNNKSWKIEKLEKFVEVIGGYAFKSGLFQKTGIPVLRIGNINTGVLRVDNLTFWDNDESLNKYMVYPKDLVISLTGTVGKDDYANVCILSDEYDKYYLNQRNAHIVIKTDIDNVYLFCLLRNKEVKSRLTGISRGVRQANISNKDILNLLIPVPPSPLQQKFAAVVEQIEVQKQKIKSAITETETLFNALMAKYFDED